MLAGDLFLVVIRDRRPLVHAPEPVDGAGIEEEGSDELRLSGPGVADERHIPEALCVVNLHKDASTVTSRQLPVSSGLLSVPVAGFQLPASSV